MCGEETVNLGDMHPRQQVRIIRLIWLAVRAGAGDPVVNRSHLSDGFFGHLNRAKRRGCKEVSGSLQPSPWVGPIVGVLRHAGHGEWMQALQQKCANAADEHCCIGVHTSNGGVNLEPPLAGCVEEFSGAFEGIVADDATADAIGKPGTYLFGWFDIGLRDVHGDIVARELTTLDLVPEESVPDQGSRWLPPRWVVPAVIIFWLASVATDVLVLSWNRLSSLILLIVLAQFFALAVEPGVNRLVRSRSWSRGRATLVIILGVLTAIGVFLGAMGTLIGTQIADLLSNSETYISDTVMRINDWFGTSIDAEQVISQFNDPNGAIQQFIDSQQGDALRLTGQALSGLLGAFTVVLFTYYLVADGPRLRRAICSRLPADSQRRVLDVWNLAIDKTGGYLYSRLLLSAVSALVHWIVFTSAGVRSPVALALWVGLISQFLPVIGTYIAAVLPVLITFLDSPVRALVVFGIIVVYQQLENYVISPRVTARTMELHPALAFGAALAGLALLGPAGAILALPIAAMLQAIGSEMGRRHEVIDSELTSITSASKRPLRRPRRRSQ